MDDKEVIKLNLAEEQRLEVVLRRIRPFETVPPSTEYLYDLSIISSVFNPSPEQFRWYWQYLVNSFGAMEARVQIIFADNSPNHNQKELLDSFGEDAPLNISLVSLYEPKRGQIHGLNGCLRKVKSPLVMKVDVDKRPAKETLSQLFCRIDANSQLDLLSARVRPELRGENLVQRSLGTRYQQWWNAGEAYVVRRKFLQGWNPVLLEDEYTYRTVMIQGGNFQVANDLPVFRRRPETLEKQSKSAARHLVGSLQLDTLTVETNNGACWNLENFKYEIPPLEQISLQRLVQHISSLQKPQLMEVPAIAAIKTVRQGLLIPYYLRRYKDKLRENPDLCTWDN